MQKPAIVLFVVLYLGIVWGLARLLVQDALELARFRDPKIVVSLVAVSVLFGYFAVALWRRG
jgi:hypothetical protein